MCGINGIFGIPEKDKAEQIIRTMNNSLAHRGPDNEGVFYSDKICFGHRRLSIIDLSSASNQPMTSSDGRLTIIYNGELYNYKELKFDLQRAPSGGGEAYLFKTNSDTEVILAAYSRWGKGCLDKFNGMYAFAISDEKSKEIFIARDRLGIKPLYYFKVENIFLFSSEIRALLSSGLVKRKVDEKSLSDYLRYQTVHAPDTIIENVKMLMPGNYMKVSEDKFEIKQYWSVFAESKNETKEYSYEKICSDVKSLFYKSVERRLVSDVPFGAFLSGGIDSSAVVGVMSKVSNTKVNTFLISFQEKEFSEAKYAKIVADKFQTNHNEILLTPSDFLTDLPDSLNVLDHPSGDGPNTYLVSKATKKAGITMALSGLGGDELFAGYNVFTRMVDLQKKKWLNAIPGFAKKMSGSLYKKLKPGISSDKLYEFLSLDNLNFNATYPLLRKVLSDERIASLLKNKLLDNAVNKIIDRKYSDLKTHLLSAVTRAEISTYMQNVLLRDTDQMSMAHALEVRVPFLDYTLVEYVLSVPDKYKYPHTPKKLLTDSLGDLLPKEIVNRPKMGFTLPWKLWMKNELKSFCEENINSLSVSGNFNGNEVKKIWNDFLNDNPSIIWSRVWHIVVLAHWLKQNKIEH